MKDLDRQALEQQLLAKLHSAEQVYRAAVDEYKAVAEEFRGMLAHPDGAAALHNAARNERVAVQQYSAALKAFSDLIVYGRRPVDSTAQETNGSPLLTTRETEVLKLIASGMRSRQIAAHLGVSFKTVVSHRSHIMEKLGIHDVVNLVRYAIRRGLIEP
jgi:DNA-binding NarL/FixJ family response regulator